MQSETNRLNSSWTTTQNQLFLDDHLDMYNLRKYPSFEDRKVLEIMTLSMSRVRKFWKDPQYFDELHPFWPHWKEEKKWIDTVYVTSAKPKHTASIAAVRSDSASRPASCGRCWCERMKPINVNAALVFRMGQKWASVFIDISPWRTDFWDAEFS
jgi:hypothetical protein